MVKSITIIFLAVLMPAIGFSQNKQIDSLSQLAGDFETKGDLPKALELYFQGLAIAEKNKLVFDKCGCLAGIGDVFWDLNDYSRAISSYQQALNASKDIKSQPGIKPWQRGIEQSLGAVFMLNNQLDSSFAHLHKLINETPAGDYKLPTLFMFYGDLQFRMGKRTEGLNYLRQSFALFQKRNDHYSLGDCGRFLSECFQQSNMIDSSIFYAKKGLEEAQSIGYRSPMLYNSKTLAELYEPVDISKALYYRKVYDTVNNIYYGPDKVKGLQKALSDEQERQRQNEIIRIAYEDRLKEYAFLGGIGALFLVAFFLYRNNRHKQKANSLLAQQKQKIESTLQELESTQAQLIQSAKMASLGELTAGIAHEIQNPLNFVNNFSEVNKELVDELQSELKSGNTEEAINISNDIKDNEEKINHHGKRADAIVKGMLQHSRLSPGHKEPTDINALCDEYLRLAYHGLRAKDKNFNADLKTDFDKTIGRINIIPQDIGRVLLNLYNNAFYAVNEKTKLLAVSYEPLVSVTTKKTADKAEIIVQDNGSGIPQNIVDKIFQPFFTTKPTGEGTGLGLSLSYDIIKAHDGEISAVSGGKAETKENAGTTFIIQLPA